MIYSFYASGFELRSPYVSNTNKKQTAAKKMFFCFPHQSPEGLERRTQINFAGAAILGETLCLKTKGSPPDPFPKQTNYILYNF